MALQPWQLDYLQGRGSIPGQGIQPSRINLPGSSRSILTGPPRGNRPSTPGGRFGTALGDPSSIIVHSPDDDAFGRESDLRPIFGDTKAFDFADYITRIISDQDEEARIANAAARRSLSGFGENLESFFGERISGIEEVLPLNPFTDELVALRQQIANDTILRQLGEAQGVEAQGLSSRGIQGGGQTAGAGALLQGKAIQGRALAEQAILGQQFDFNQRSNLAREELISGLTAPQANLQGRFDTLSAALEAGNVTDPALEVASLQNLFRTETTRILDELRIESAREEGIRTEDLSRELAQPNPFDELIDFFTAIGLPANLEGITSFLGLR